MMNEKTAVLLVNRILLYTLYIDPHYTSTQVFHCNRPLWREPSGQSLFSVPRMLGCFFFCTARFESNTWTTVGHCFNLCIKVLVLKSSIEKSTNVNNNKPKTSWWFTTPLKNMLVKMGILPQFSGFKEKMFKKPPARKKWPPSQIFKHPKHNLYSPFSHQRMKTYTYPKTPTKCQVSGVFPFPEKKKVLHVVVETRLLGDITTVEDLLRQGIVDLVAFCGTNLPAATDPWLHEHEFDGKSKLCQVKTWEEKNFIFNSTINWLYIILHRDPFNLLKNRYSSTSQARYIFSKIQLSRNVDWQYTWNLLVKYGCVMEDFNVIVSKEFCALAAMLLPTVWGATPSEERCWKKFGKDLGGYCTTHKQCQPGINKPPKLGGGLN